MKSLTRKPLRFLPIAAIAAAAALGAAAGDAAASAPRDRARAPAPPASSGLQLQITAGHGRLGISVLQVSRELRAHLGAPSDRGVLVDAVRPDSAAARAGLRVGDVVLEVDGDPATSATGMLNAIADRGQGDQVAIALLRDRRRIELTATLAGDPGPRRSHFVREVLRGAAFGPWQRQLDEARRRIEELEQRLEKLERI